MATSLSSSSSSSSLSSLNSSFSSSSSSSSSSSKPRGIGSLASYETFEQVGEGTYGYVFRAKDRRTNELVALKRLIFHKETSGFPLCAVREIKFLKSLSHKNIVKLRDVASSKGCEHLETPTKMSASATAAVAAAALAKEASQANGSNKSKGNKQIKSEKSSENVNNSEEGGGEIEKDIPLPPNPIQQACGNLYLVFEYVEHDLGGLVDAKYKFNMKEIKCIMKQLFEALDYLSERKVVHRDIKSSNILISNRHQVKLADFGLARSIVGPDGREGKMDMTNNVITMWYKPPELLLGAVRYSHPVDMWSTGCVMAELELGRPLFPGKTEVQQLEMICKVMGTPSEDGGWTGVSALPNYDSMLKSKPKETSTLRSAYSKQLSPDVLSLLERILVLDPSRRTSARIALSHSFFLSAPLPPINPTDLEPLSLEAGSSMHEFQTKQRRRLKDPFSIDCESGDGDGQAASAITSIPQAPPTLTLPSKAFAQPPSQQPSQHNGYLHAVPQQGQGQGQSHGYAFPRPMAMAMAVSYVGQGQHGYTTVPNQLPIPPSMSAPMSMTAAPLSVNMNMGMGMGVGVPMPMAMPMPPNSYAAAVMSQPRPPPQLQQQHQHHHNSNSHPQPPRPHQMQYSMHNSSNNPGNSASSSSSSSSSRSSGGNGNDNGYYNMGQSQRGPPHPPQYYQHQHHQQHPQQQQSQYQTYSHNSSHNANNNNSRNGSSSSNINSSNSSSSNYYGNGNSNSNQSSSSSSSRKRSSGS